MEYYSIVFKPLRSKYSLENYNAVLEQISDHIVAEIKTHRYGRYSPIHHDECAYASRKGPKFAALIECRRQHIRPFTDGLKGTLGDGYDIHYQTAKPVRGGTGRELPH